MVWLCTFLPTLLLTTLVCSHKLHPLSDEYIRQINNKQSTWRAGRNFDIEEYELFKALISRGNENEAPKVYKKIHDENEDVPESFDAREQWPECADVISLIRDQSKCGAGWAFGAVESMSDRICIQSNATKKQLVSAQDLITCGHSGSCLGGWVANAWQHWVDDGIVTGGLYHRTDQGCKSYFLPPCDDHMNNCTDFANTPDCSEVCDDSSLNYESQKTYGKEFYDLTGEDQIQLEILKNGPVEASMSVYEDFANYKSGIYQVTNDSYAGGHSVKIIGWGVENDTKYWLVANSWNERWGENGYFRIVRGQGEVGAGIERYIVAGTPDFSRF